MRITDFVVVLGDKEGGILAEAAACRRLDEDFPPAPVRGYGNICHSSFKKWKKHLDFEQ